jgi:hypothetical protein
MELQIHHYRVAQVVTQSGPKAKYSIEKCTNPGYSPKPRSETPQRVAPRLKDFRGLLQASVVYYGTAVFQNDGGVQKMVEFLADIKRVEIGRGGGSLYCISSGRQVNMPFYAIPIWKRVTWRNTRC